MGVNPRNPKIVKMEQDDVKINLNNAGTKTQLFTFRTTCKMQQKNVKQF